MAHFRSRLTDLGRIAVAGSLLCAFGSGCVTVAEFRKLERQVTDLERKTGKTGPERQELAETGAEIDKLRAEMRKLAGRIEVAEKQSSDSVRELKRLRQELAGLSARSAEGEPGDPAAEPETAEASQPEVPVSAEAQAYRVAYAAWRANDHETCIEEFRGFLQTYPASPYADDSAFWMADCHFKQGDYKNAVLRFDDVVRNYPTGNKAPDALYRQGESLLKLGPSYQEAAKRAFQRVVKEYPDSARAREAKGQLELIGAG